MKNLSKDQATSLVLDPVKKSCRKTKETFSSLKRRDYKTASEIAQLNIPSSYLFSEKEGRLFFCTLSGCTEVMKASVKRKGWEIF